MADIEKVIKGLEKWIDDPLAQNAEIEPQLVHDALELLKEQEHKDKMYHTLEDDWKRLKELLKEQESWINEIAEYQQSISGSGMHELDDYEKGKWDGLQIAWSIISEGR